MATTPYFEAYEPYVQENGLNTAKNVDFTGSSSVALPSGTTIGGSSVVALGNITSSSTTATAFSVTNTGVFTGTNVQSLVADSATTGTIFAISGAGLTTGHGLVITAAGTILTTGDALSVVAANATTSTGIVRVSATSLTTGFAMAITGGGTNVTSAGGGINVTLGAATAGTALKATTTGTYTGTTGIVAVNGTAATTGLLLVANATAATLTTGRYFSANDAAGEVFGIGANGHIHSTVGATAPTIAVTTQAGITAAAITAGGSDTCGTITTTGTSTGATQITVTFNKTYTTAPKTVCITPANASAAMPNTGYYVDAITATTFRITVAAGGTYAATPSWYYQVIA